MGGDSSWHRGQWGPCRWPSRPQVRVSPWSVSFSEYPHLGAKGELRSVNHRGRRSGGWKQKELGKDSNLVFATRSLCILEGPRCTPHLLGILATRRLRGSLVFLKPAADINKATHPNSVCCLGGSSPSQPGDRPRDEGKPLASATRPVLRSQGVTCVKPPSTAGFLGVCKASLVCCIYSFLLYTPRFRQLIKDSHFGLAHYTL